MSNNKDLLLRMQRYQRTWNLGANCLQFAHISLGILAISSSLIVATFTHELGDFYTRIFAFISALSFGVVNSINLGEKANNFRRATRHLNVGLMRFLGGLSSEQELIDTYKECEDIISDWKFVPPRQQQS
ncbi:MAG: hypothetical protein RMX68_011375 [Aulosira sp. ZfuVER01]|nr:hypothetical protein [Aulosira sp. ZfuVER01]MDZ7996949.1 hypothetical protein [Aulosira sp. DedVER01a]MDZ8050568.1 hypothetical protein [Aulosira sp. ZfuCHP01]